MILDITEVSYNNNNSKSNLLNSNQQILEETVYTSDSDYSYISDKKNGKKKKSKKNDSRKPSKSKKTKRTNKTNTTEKKKIAALPLVNQSEDDSEIEKKPVTTLSHINTLSGVTSVSINPLNIKQDLKPFLIRDSPEVVKHFKISEPGPTSVFSKGLPREYILYKNQLPKPLTIKYDKKSGNYMNASPLLISPTVKLIPITTTGLKKLEKEKSTLESICLRQEADKKVEGKSFLQ